MGRCIAILPAGGTGSRFGAVCPKQFTLLLGQPLLVHSIQTLLKDARIQAIHVVVSPEYATSLDCSPWQGRVTLMPCAGQSRAQTVRQALDVLAPALAADDWILVHDAARPCLSESALRRLLDALWSDPVGGLLAVPVADTLKQSGEDGRVSKTVDRSGLWAAQTPQMFRSGILRAALRQADHLTDESAAVEALGHSPRLVQGDPANIKVTYPEDLLYAQWVLESRHSAKGESA
ncbi:MAG: 2-C-methyl-D-erythritol 4-phosphate cytidylyltransferase [Betaproteobacteria bacterium]|nr:2-C-methyl-D-erythritol 4-phosphate cytidylyltransferase [Betaproteobacteria bacterium]